MMKLRKDGKPDGRQFTGEKGPRPNSGIGWLASFKPGERRWVEHKHSNLATSMGRLVPAKSRWSPSLRHMNFRTSAWTAVSASNVGQCRVLICVERVADSDACPM